MLFYAALHVVEGALASEARHNTTHSDRELYLKERHGKVWPPYHRLQTESMKARYLQGGAFLMNARSVDSELRRGKFREVVRYCRGLFPGT